MRRILWTSALLMMLSIGCGAGEDLLLGAKPSTEPPLKESVDEDQPGEESRTVSLSNEKVKTFLFRFEGPLVMASADVPRCPQIPGSIGRNMASEADVPHLGHTVMNVSVCYNYLTLGLGRGEGVFTAANGDTPNITRFGGSFEYLSLEDLAYRWVGTMTINGGSGRFQNATGVLSSILFVWEWHPERNYLLLNGAISY